MVVVAAAGAGLIHKRVKEDEGVAAVEVAMRNVDVVGEEAAVVVAAETITRTRTISTTTTEVEDAAAPTRSSSARGTPLYMLCCGA